jgi:predicted RND superfamily exporter protein
MYGMGAVAGSSRAGQDALKIEEEFGKENLLALLVPRGQTGKESELSKTLHDMDDVRRVVSYVDLVGEEIPPDYLDRATLGRFYSDNYALFIIYTDTTEESDGAFRAVEDIRSAAAMYYDGVYLAGQSATLYDIRNTVSADTKIVNLCAVIGIFLTILVTFRSVSIPLLLLFTIETAIWLNLSIGYFTGNTYNYIGYLIIGTVQLGSTVDYAILLTDRYLDLRREHPKKEAATRALGGNLLSILTSAAILSMAGFTLSMTSTNPIVAELGELLGRGTLLSLAMVCLVLPALLTVFDGLIQKTTLNHGFGKGRKSP